MVALPVQALASLLQGCPSRWWLSGGWAIDHWAGTVSRSHGDIDISTLGPALPALLGSLPGHLEPFAAMDGDLYPLALRLDDPGLHNIWFRDRRHGRWVLQLNIEAGDRAAWRYRRDPRIALPWGALTHADHPARLLEHIADADDKLASDQRRWS